MIGVDTQLLVYAARADSSWHAPALGAVRSLAESGAPWAIPWPCAHEFLVVMTHPNVYSPPATTMQAFSALDAWLQSGTLTLLGEGPEHLERLRSVGIPAKIAGPRIHDAKIAAICLEAGVAELWTADRDFTAFPALRTRNPLVKRR